MQTKSAKETQMKYSNLKKEYDNLLEKNQNDLIKIKIREKQLNDKIAAIQKEKEQSQAIMKAEIESLKNIIKQHDSSTILPQQKMYTVNELSELTQAISHKNQQIFELKNKIVVLDLSEAIYKQKNDRLEKEVRQLKDELIKVRQENNITIQQVKNAHNQSIVSGNNSIEKKLKTKQVEIDQYRKQCQIQEAQRISIQKQFKIVKQKLIEYQVKFQRKDTQNEQELEDSKKLIHIMQQKLRKTTQEMKIELKKRQHLQSALKLNQEQIKNKNLEIKSISQMYAVEKSQKQVCSKCEELQQQLQLHQQMLKSVKMMLKFKQMELQNKKK